MRVKRDNILFILTILISINLQGFALTPTQNLAMIENHIFGYENSKMTETQRLDTIEKFVYGKTQNSNINTRLNHLNEDLGLTTTNENKIASTPNFNHPQQEQDYANEPTDPTAQYPVVDNLETSLLSKTFKNENIYKRLDRLEQKAYGKILKGSLSERVERLSTLVEPITPQKSYDEYMANNNDYNYYSPATNGNPRASSAQTYIPEQMPSIPNTSALLALEQNVLGKTYTTDSTSRRLSRLEKKILNKDFATEPDELRIERLTTVANAQQSSQVYKESKLMQHVSTGIQIGGMILMLLAMIL